MKYLRPYNESIMINDLKEALVIYEEDLPFSMVNIDIDDNDKSYVIRYEHIDDSLKNIILKDFDITNIRNKVEGDADFYFNKFAKKYNLEYFVSDVNIDFITPNDFTVNVRIKFKK